MKNNVLGGGLASLAILARNTCKMAEAAMIEGPHANPLAQFGLASAAEKVASPPKAKATQVGIVDNWLEPCCICDGIEFTGATFVDSGGKSVESFWCVTCQEVPDGGIKTRRVNSPPAGARRPMPPKWKQPRCKACGKESYGSIHGGRFCKACGASCCDSER